MAVATLMSVAVATWSSLEWRRAEEELYRTADRLCALANDRSRDFADIESAVEDTLREYYYLQKPLNPAGLAVLKNGGDFFGRYVERDYGEEQNVRAHPVAYKMLGMINHGLDQIARSVAAYAESRRLLQQLCDKSPDRTSRFLLALTNRSLGCLFASTGRAAEAERLTSAAVAELNRLLAEDPDDFSARSVLCEASRNLGLILAMLGRNGTEDVRHSIEQSRLLVSESPEEIRVVEYFVDSQQILAQLLWRQGEYSEAENTCRKSIQEIDRLLERLPVLSRSNLRKLPTLKYRQARAMAQANLARFRRKLEEDLPSVGNWQWKPLVQWPGRILQADFLLRGTLAGEFENQDALLMVWLDEAWCDEILVKMVAETYRRTQIIILVENELIEEETKQALAAADVPTEDVRFCHAPTDTMWVRDYGPIVIDTGDGTHQCIAPRRPLDIHRLNDAHASLAVSRKLGITVAPAPFLLDGGGLLSNGEGLCIVSAGLLEKNRQFGYPESHVTNAIKRLFGAENVVYLDPLHGEPTGHVDLFATFTSSDTIVIGDYQGTDPVNAQLLDRHARRLAGVRTANGPLKVVRIPMPPRREKCFGSYTNVVFANGTLLVPTYAEAPPDLERQAFEVYHRLLPGWRVVGLDCSELIVRQGALHCAVVNLHRSPEYKSDIAVADPGAAQPEAG
jgi:agmatine/peptidylarginine deiminase